MSLIAQKLVDIFTSRTVPLIVFLTALSSCSYQDSKVELTTNIGQQVFGRTANSTAPALTQGVETATDPTKIQLIRVNTSGLATLNLIDAAPDRRTFASVIRQTVTIQSDYIIRTQGLGKDLMSLRTNAKIAPRANLTSVRTLRYLDGELATVAETFSCVTSAPKLLPQPDGNKQISALTMEETCTNNKGSHVNVYIWKDANAAPWRFRQWVGPEIGYLIVTYK